MRIFRTASLLLTIIVGASAQNPVKVDPVHYRPPTRTATENVATTDTEELMAEFKDADNGGQGTRVSGSQASVRDRLVGTWRVVSAGTLKPDGTLEPFPEYGPRAIGYLMYDTTGHMCASLSNPDHPRWADAAKPTDAEKIRSYEKFFAYCGAYEVREKEGRVIHRPEMGSSPYFIGTDQSRDFRLEGNRLILSAEEAAPGGQPLRYQITWERVPPK